MIFAYDFAYDKSICHHDAANLLTMHFSGQHSFREREREIERERERQTERQTETEREGERDDNLCLKTWMLCT